PATPAFDPVGAPATTLPRGAIHVWGVRLDVPEGAVGRLARALSADEHARARRFHFERDRRRFVVRRAALRGLLANYLGAEPAELRFEYSGHGKPRLAAP